MEPSAEPDSLLAEPETEGAAEVEQPAGPVVAWPWPDLTPADFTSGENEFFKTRDMTPAEVESLGIKDVTGGVIGVSVGAEGKVYTFSLRPLLPDEIK